MLISELGRGGKTLLIPVTELDKIMPVTESVSPSHSGCIQLLTITLTFISTMSLLEHFHLSLSSVNKSKKCLGNCLPSRLLWTLLDSLGLELNDHGAKNLA